MFHLEPYNGHGPTVKRKGGLLRSIIEEGCYEYKADERDHLADNKYQAYHELTDSEKIERMPMFGDEPRVSCRHCYSPHGFLLRPTLDDYMKQATPRYKNSCRRRSRRNNWRSSLSDSGSEADSTYSLSDKSWAHLSRGASSQSVGSRATDWSFCDDFHAEDIENTALQFELTESASDSSEQVTAQVASDQEQDQLELDQPTGWTVL